MRPSSRLAFRLALYFLGPPLLVLLIARAPALAAGLGAFGALVGAAAVWRDRLGGAWACADAAVPAILAVFVLLLLERLMSRHWPDVGAAHGRAAALPVLFVVAACVAFFHPFCYYPDVDTHGRFLQALRDNPSLLVDPTQLLAKARRRHARSGTEGPHSVRDGVPRLRRGRSRRSSATPARFKTVAVISAAAVVPSRTPAGGGAGSDVGDGGAAPAAVLPC